MGIYKPKRRTAEGQEEIKLPISSVDISIIDLQDTSDASISSEKGISVLRDCVISGAYPLTNPPQIQTLVIDRIPIIEGENVTFEVANNGQCVKISATGGEVDTSNLATVDKVKSISTKGLGRSNFLLNDGIQWNDTLSAFDGEQFLGKQIANSDIIKHVPIVAGDNVNFTVDEENQVVKINAPESMIGTWVFNDNILGAAENSLMTYPVEFYCPNVSKEQIYTSIVVSVYDSIVFISYMGTSEADGIYDDGWNDDYKTIEILKEPSADASAWIRANAKKKEPIGVDKITLIDTWAEGVSELGTDGGIYWTEGFTLQNAEYEALASGEIAHRIPLVAGENITFEVDQSGGYVKINAEEGVIGDWVLYDLYEESADIEFNFSGYDAHGIERQFNRIRIEASDGDFTVTYYTDDDREFLVCSTYDDMWENPASKIITITEEPTTEAANLIKTIAKRKETVGADTIGVINSRYGTPDIFVVTDNGIEWENNFRFIYQNNTTSEGIVAQRVPIVAGNGISFETDEQNRVVKINSNAGGSGGTSNAIPTVKVTTEPAQMVSTILDAIEAATGSRTSVAYVSLSGYVNGRYLMQYTSYGSTFGMLECTNLFTGERIYNNANQNVFDTASKTIKDFIDEGTPAPRLPNIRYANCEMIEESDFPVYRFTVENLGGGTLQEGDKLQICCRRKYPGNKYKLRKMAEVDITYDDLSSRFLKIEVDCSNNDVFKWLFKNDRSSAKASTFSPIYFRLKRVTKWNDDDGSECNAIFSNVETAWKTYKYDKSLYGGADVSSLKIK